MKTQLFSHPYKMASRLLLTACLAFILLPSCLPTQRGNTDAAYFNDKKLMLTARWEKPFSREETESRHAPKGPFLGNGDVGITTYTSFNRQTLRIGKVDFITDNWEDWTGNGPAALPVGGLEINVHSQPAEGFCYEMSQLEAELRMKTGTHEQVDMTTWMTMDDNYVVTELSTASEKPVAVTVTTYAGCEDTCYATTADICEEIAQVSRRTKSEGNVRWINRAGISTRTIGTESRKHKLSESQVTEEFTIAAGKPVYVVAYVSGSENDNARLPETAEKLRSLTLGKIALLKKGKEDWWKDMWTRSYVETYDSLLDRQYLSSIYLMASAYNLHSPVCGGMYGVWNMNDTMNYHGDIHLNYNSQAGFYSMFSSNRPELAMPYYDFLEKLIPEGKRRAKEELGLVHPSLKGKSCRGLLFPVSALGNGYFYCQYWQQTINAPYNIPLYSWYYEYTGDEKFLRERAYPFIRECGDFYEDYLEKKVQGDTYRYNITTGGHENSWDLNPPSDLGFVELTFRLLLRYSEQLGVDTQRRALWTDIVTHLPQYKVIMPTKKPNQGLPVYAKNENGWDLPSHVIQLHPVYPCEVLNLHSDSTALQLARNTLYYYAVSQKGFTETMNELGLSAFIMGARIGFSPELLIENMKTLIGRTGQNFLILDGHHCLEKTTFVETINSMMLQSVDGILHLFPCWPASPASFTRLRTKGAFLVSASYNGKSVTSLKIESTNGGICKLQNPWPGKQIKITEEDVTVSYKQEICSFQTQKGHTYCITPQM